MRNALDAYLRDHYQLPEGSLDAADDLSALVNALLTRDVAGSRYLSIRDVDIVVKETDGFREMRRNERDDPRVRKAVLDGFRNPLVFHRDETTFALYSCGPNGIDDTALRTPDAENDDVSG
jgi:hypothetical protein